MKSIIELQRICWLLQGAVGAFVAVATAAYGIWITFSANSFFTHAFLLLPTAFALLAGGYFVNRVLRLWKRWGNTAEVKIFLQAEYNLAIGSWCLVIAAFAFMVNANA